MACKYSIMFLTCFVVVIHARVPESMPFLYDQMFMRSNDKFVVSGYQLFDCTHIFINVFKLTDVNPNQPYTLGVNSSNYFNDVK